MDELPLVDELKGMEDDEIDIDVSVVLPEEMDMSAVSDEEEEEYAGKMEGGLEDKV